MTSLVFCERFCRPPEGVVQLRDGHRHGRVPDRRSLDARRHAGAPFVLTTVGLRFTFAGPLLVSNRLAEPNYDVMLAWDPDSMPPTGRRARTRYFALNWIRAAATWAAFALFLAALLKEMRSPV